MRLSDWGQRSNNMWRVACSTSADIITNWAYQQMTYNMLTCSHVEK